MSDYTCVRCGRETGRGYDHSKVELQRFFEQRKEGHNPDFFILCRFCTGKLVRFLHGDDPSEIEYRNMEEWLLPPGQKEEFEDGENDG